MARNPLVPVALSVLLGLLWIARGTEVLGSVSNPLAMFFFGGLDLLVAAGVLLALPPIRYVACGVFGLQVLVALWQGSTVAFMFVGAMSPTALLVATLARRSVGRFASYATAAFGILVLFVAGAASPAASVAHGGDTAGSQDVGALAEVPRPGPMSATDTGFGVTLKRPEGLVLVDDPDDLAKLFVAPKPAPHRLVIAFASPDHSIGGFVMVERVAVVQGVPIRNFATRIVGGLPGDVSDDDRAPDARVIPAQLPPPWSRAEHIVLDYAWNNRGLPLDGAVAAVKVSDGRIVSIVVVGPQIASERVHHVLEMVAASLTVTGMAN